MNWLAHLRLSEPRIDHQLGNLLADIVRRPSEELTADFRRGIETHRRIDSFTERHPVVRASRSRVTSVRGRYAGIVVDVLYDHFLAAGWERFADEPLERFLGRFYAHATAYPHPLPEPARDALEWIVASDTLSQYAQLEGIGRALERLSRRMTARLGVAVDLAPALDDLRARYDAFEADFSTFWPDLAAHATPTR